MIYRIPFPPSLWQAYYRRGRFQVKSSVYNAFINETYKALDKQSFKITEHSAYILNVSYHSPSWFNKNKTIKKKDLDNYQKCFIDTITTYLSRNQDFDDSRIFEIHALKIPSHEEYVEFELLPSDRALIWLRR